MTKLRRLGPTMWITLVVYLFVVGSGTSMAACCLSSDRGGTAQDEHECSHSHKHAAAPSAHDHSSEPNQAPASDSQCHCSILPVGAANSSGATLGTAASPESVQGTASALCLIDPSLDSVTYGGGGRYPPQVSGLNSILNSLQTVLLLI